MKSKTKIFVIVIALVLVLGVAIRILFGVIFTNKSDGFFGESVKKPSITVVATEVKLGNVKSYLNLAGEIRGIEEANVFPDVPGKIRKIVALEGSFVRRGDVIMYIDRDVVGLEYQPSPVRSPISGKVGNILYTEGQFVSQTTPVATVVNDSIVEVSILLPEKYIGKISKNSEVLVKVSKFQDKIYRGKISSLDVIIDRNTRTLRVRVRIQNDGNLISGMFANVSILTEADYNVAYVPNSAIVNLDGKSFVYVASNISSKDSQNTTNNFDNPGFSQNIYKVYMREVVTGVSDGNIVSVKGVKPGEKVVSLGTEYLKDGIMVNVIEE